MADPRRPRSEKPSAPPTEPKTNDGVPPDPDLARFPWEYEDHLDDMSADLSRSVTPGKGCIVRWHCRVTPVPNVLRACEANCLWTSRLGQVLPNCYGYYRGCDVLEEGDLLYPVVQKACERCLHQKFCRMATTERRGEPVEWDGAGDNPG